MVIEVRACREGEPAADFVDGRIVLAEEGYVAVTIHDPGRTETAVIMLHPDEAWELARKLAIESRTGHRYLREAAGRSGSFLRAVLGRNTPGARAYKEQGGPW